MLTRNISSVTVAVRSLDQKEVIESKKMNKHGTEKIDFVFVTITWIIKFLLLNILFFLSKMSKTNIVRTDKQQNTGEVT